MPSSDETARDGRKLWRELDVETRIALSNKLDGLYGQAGDGAAFDALGLDKQRALLIFMRRLQSLNLWHAVRRVVNVYGLGGVGMSFEAWPFLVSTLSRHARFTSRLARHRDSLKGFYELHNASAALHFLYMKDERGEWSVHFDLHSPVASLASAARHLYHEVFHGATPGWRQVEEALRLREIVKPGGDVWR